MKRIPISKGLFAIVDDEDHELVSWFKWTASKPKHVTYAQTWVRRDGNKTGYGVLSMHRMIMGLRHGDKRHVDHLNFNGLDNRRSNLRIVSQHESQRHRRKVKPGRTRFKGVKNANNATRPFEANIRVHGNAIYLGSFKTDVEAAKAYDQAAKKYFGEHAHLNFPP